MAGLGLLERVNEDLFNANAITKHMVDMPSAQHGAVHLCVPRLLTSDWSTETDTFIAPPKE